MKKSRVLSNGKLTTTFAFIFVVTACTTTTTTPTPSPTDDEPTDGVNCSVSDSGCSCLSYGTANSFECDPSSLGSGSYCCADKGWPNGGNCECETPQVTCGDSDLGDFWDCACAAVAFFSAGDEDSGYSTGASNCYSGGKTSPSTGGSCCLDTSQEAQGLPALCECTSGLSACPAGTSAVTSCSASMAALKAPYCDSGQTQVSSCSTGGTTSTGNGTNSCNSGPGTCTNPASANNCRNGAVCERLCPTCDYGCYMNCSTDSECNGFCDSAGNQLSCNPLFTGQTLRDCGGLY